MLRSACITFNGVAPTVIGLFRERYTDERDKRIFRGTYARRFT